MTLLRRSQWVFTNLAKLFCVAVIGSSVGARLYAQAPQRLVDVVRYNAPAIIAEVRTANPNCDNCNFYRNRITDHLIATDFDGDQSGWNQVTNMDADLGRMDARYDTRPVVYYSIEETENFYFIGYYFYHIRDGGTFIDGVTFDSGHDSDLEGIFLLVQKLPYDPYGHPIAAVTEAHGALLPFGVPGWIDWDHAQTNVSGIGAFAGQVEFWHDYTMNRDRPIAAIRSSTHGTYMAQDCSPYSTSYFWDGFGASGPNNNGYATACVHRDAASWVYYQPAPYDAYATNMSDTTAQGTYWYRLQEVSGASFWATRADMDGYFNGDELPLGHGLVGLSQFVPYGGANPMWAWRGGAGESSGYWGHTGYWYSFAMDQTSTIHYEPGQWAPLSRDGELLADAHIVGIDMFGQYSSSAGNAAQSFGGTIFYNSVYDVNASPPPPAPLTVEIIGPTTVDPGVSNEYFANASGGVGPYNYTWSGLASGIGRHITFSTQVPGVLYLDVTDATGAHTSVSMYIDVTGGG
jgi:hypothetical protein